MSGYDDAVVQLLSKFKRMKYFEVHPAFVGENDQYGDAPLGKGPFRGAGFRARHGEVQMVNCAISRGKLHVS